MSDAGAGAGERGAGFATLIRRRRLALGIDQAQLAGRLKVSQQTVSRWEAGDNVPGTKHLRGIADALRMSESEVLVSAGVADGGSGDVHVHLAYVLRHLSDLDKDELLTLLDAAWSEHRGRIIGPTPAPSGE